MPAKYKNNQGHERTPANLTVPPEVWLRATTRRPSRGSHAQVCGGGAADVCGADGAPPETAGPPHCARPGAVVAAALAAAELVLAAFLFLQASRLILLLSLSDRFLPRLGGMLAASTDGAAGVAVLQY